MKLLRSLAAGSFAASIVLASTLPAASAASADVTHHEDATHDVLSQTLDQTGNPKHPEGQRKKGDIARTTVDHHTDVVDLTMKYRQLSRSGLGTVHVFTLKTDQGMRRVVSLYAEKHHWGGHLQVENANGSPRTCDVSYHIDYVRNRVDVTIPRSCLNNPSWVRVGMGIGILTKHRAYADDASINSGVKHMLRCGPRMHHD